MLRFFFLDSNDPDLSIWLGLRKRIPGGQGCYLAPYTEKDRCDGGYLMWVDDEAIFEYDEGYMGEKRLQ